MRAGLRDRSRRQRRIEQAAHELQLNTSGELARMRIARLLRWSGGAVPSRDSRWWAASPMDRTGSLRRGRIWLARSLCIRPSSTAMRPWSPVGTGFVLAVRVLADSHLLLNRRLTSLT
jgi:hypothetical protein